MTAPGPRVPGRTRVALLLLVATVAACELPGRGYGLHRARVDSVLVADTVAPDAPLEVRIVGVVGVIDCDVLDRIERVRAPGGLFIELWTRHPNRDDCAEAVIPLDTTLVEAPLTGDSAFVVVRGATEHIRIVHIRRPRSERTVVTLHFNRGDGLVAVEREVPETSAMLRATLRELLRGPTPQERTGSGARSWFSERTSGLLHNVALEDGLAIIDFDEDLAHVIPGASSSYGSSQLIRSLNATVFQFPSVEQVEYRLGGSCEAFWAWLQYACEIVDRDWEP